MPSIKNSLLQVAANFDRNNNFKTFINKISLGYW